METSKTSSLKLKRIIARLDIKGQNVIKGVHLEGLKIVGAPEQLSKKYLEQNADEIFFQDSVASLYGRNNLSKIVQSVAANINIPLTVGGGLKNIEDIEEALISGADKVAINTKFIEDKKFISKSAIKFGSQAIVGSIEAKFIKNDKKFIAFTDNGRNISKYNVLEWIKILENEGIGEIILTSVDFEGTQKGFDLKLLEKVNKIIKVPLIVSGGIGNINHITECVKYDSVSAIALASTLHFNQLNINEIKKKILNIKTLNYDKKFNIKKNINSVSILKTKLCNFRSLYNSLKKVCDVKVLDKNNINSTRRLILPGVGTFNELINELDEEKLSFINKIYKKNLPILGICLGAQVLFTIGHENKVTNGLDYIKGKVVHLSEFSKKQDRLIPNIGWISTKFKKHKIFENISDLSPMYYVHSYNFKPENKDTIYATFIINNAIFNAVCIKDNLIACQFHPEKSGSNGLKLLSNFSNINS